MSMIEADIALKTDCTLGEGPVWWEDALWFVDIEGRCLHRFDPNTREHTEFKTDRRIGFAIPSVEHGWVIAQDASIATWRPGRSEPLPRFELESPTHDLRFNDGKCDPGGRLYAGTMHLRAEPSAGSLFRFDRSFREECIADRVTISNGLAWDSPTSSMYFIDTATGRVDRFAWDADTGAVHSRTPIATIEDGVPDGMAIDVDGYLWIAIWGGSRVARIDPASGREVGGVYVPCPNVTSCCFGGERFDRLWITTAQIGLNDDELGRHPDSGSVFVAAPGVAGRSTTPMH